MGEELKYQLRLTLSDPFAKVARDHPDDPSIAPLRQLLRRHDAAETGMAGSPATGTFGRFRRPVPITNIWGARDAAREFIARFRRRGRR
jgi:hypothetical protein